mmetsp:Transcript_6721/g.19423  ORF Transcript_6721/g.19423 Transcript_6721/m.19423 type:complete len:148 (+) Transcript_6721:670-1113(+)
MIGVESGPGNTCQGDSGGPLLVRTEQADGTFVDTRIGITSFGLCNFEEAAGFTRTSSVVDWIRTTACVDLGSTADFCNTPSKAPTMAPTQTISKSSKKTKSSKKSTKVPTKAPTKAQVFQEKLTRTLLRFKVSIELLTRAALRHRAC